MMPQLAKEAGATEELKASDPMKWVGLKMCIRDRTKAGRRLSDGRRHPHPLEKGLPVRQSGGGGNKPWCSGFMIKKL